MHIMFYLIGLTAIFFIAKKKHHSGKIISLILCFFWLWMGIIYHFTFFSAINKTAYIFGTFFIVQGILFLYYGIIQNKLSFQIHPDVCGIFGSLLILFALIIYPVFGYFAGHVYPSSPTFGLPCPTTIFTFGLLLWTDKKCPVPILFVPFLWSLIGFTAAFSLAVYEDIGLLISGLSATIMILVRNKKLTDINGTQD